MIGKSLSFMLESRIGLYERCIIIDSIESKSDFLIFSMLKKPALLIALKQLPSHYYTIKKKFPCSELEAVDVGMDFSAIINTIKSSEKKMVIIDDLACFLFQGVTVLELIEFVQELQIACQGKQLIICSHDIPKDTELKNLNMLVAYTSDLILKARRLESGYTLGVDGELEIALGPQSDESTAVESILLYRLTDGGVHYFTKGNS